MKKFYLLFLILPTLLFAKPYVNGKLTSQLGNQLFIVAATTSLALENGAEPIFPDFISDPNKEGRKLNHEMIFYAVNTSLPRKRPSAIYKEPFFYYTPIKYVPNMELRGYFQSEKYFKKHEKEIRELFAPSEKINDYLQEKYTDILNHPQTVAIHLRSYEKDSQPNLHPTLPRKYYELALKKFPQDSKFVVFSNDMNHAKKVMSFFKGDMIFIENQNYIYDFYLMTKCKNQIISNSTFAWWGAYLNSNPEKIVVAPRLWCGPSIVYKFEDLVPDTWQVVEF